MLEVTVIDSGIGISKADQKKLFKLFGFLDSSSSINKNGIGLGLHISQQITAEFGGEIVVESEKDEGSTFSFVFDLHENTQHANTIVRNLNPIKKKYPKIILDVMNEDEDDLSNYDDTLNEREKLEIIG